ncbi:hypothetical protein, partial [Corynebacterium nasicanis]
LLARQAVALASGEADPVTLSEAAATQARALLDAEYAHLHGLEVAQAFHDVPAPLIDASEHRIHALRELLAPSGDVPVAAPGYAVSGDLQPADEGFVAALESAREARWLRAVSDAQDDAWRAWVARTT